VDEEKIHRKKSKEKIRKKKFKGKKSAGQILKEKIYKKTL